MEKPFCAFGELPPVEPGSCFNPQHWRFSLADRPGSPDLNRRTLLPRKEVIQPHLPVQLPCYDFVPVTDPTLGACLPDKSGLAQRLQVLPTSMT